MDKKIPVGVLGATGMVGQQYIRLLSDHPWFEVAYVAASPSSAGKKYSDALKGGWIVEGEVPAHVGSLIVGDVANVKRAEGSCALVFSAFEMPDKEAIKAT
ncbi:MAG: Aspartate-semialdehyde dehydrogenase, partial [Candidatus Kaiserbacteria bacterium GW2011_GWB1_50_17]